MSLLSSWIRWTRRRVGADKALKAKSVFGTAHVMKFDSRYVTPHFMMDPERMEAVPEHP